MIKKLANTEDKPINKMNLKECKAALRKLKNKRIEYEMDLEFAEDGIDRTDDLISEAKERIKKLTPKKKP
jgi:hypothetical protein